MSVWTLANTTPRAGFFSVPVNSPRSRVGLHPPEHVAALAQDLLAVRDEQDAPELRSRGVEGGEPRLAEPGRHHDETRGVTGEARAARARRAPPVGSVAAPGGCAAGSGSTSGGAGRFGSDRGSVVPQQLVGERVAARVVPEPLEAVHERRHLVDADAPLDAAVDARSAQVAAADERARRWSVR